MSKYMNLIGRNARKAVLEKINSNIKNKVLNRYSVLLNIESNSIIKANEKDIKFALKKGLKSNLVDRLTINHEKLNNIKNSINKITKLKDPIDNTLQNGLDLMG